jgi:Spy/CpxP family protein refolding chaperone
MQIRSIALALAVLGAAAPIAGAQVAQAPRASHEQAAGNRGERGMRGLTRGIALTSAEKANIKAVQANYAPKFKALRAAMKPDVQKLRAARKQGDSATVKALWASTAAQRSRSTALREQEQKDIRAALAPEHQAQFDQNVARFQQMLAKRSRDRGARTGSANPQRSDTVEKSGR